MNGPVVVFLHKNCIKSPAQLMKRIVTRVLDFCSRGSTSFLIVHAWIRGAISPLAFLHLRAGSSPAQRESPNNRFPSGCGGDTVNRVQASVGLFHLPSPRTVRFWTPMGHRYSIIAYRRILSLFMCGVEMEAALSLL